MNKRRRESLLFIVTDCFWCQKELNSITATLDHVVPKALGGNWSIENCVLACSNCNALRGKLTNILIMIRKAKKSKDRDREYKIINRLKSKLPGKFIKLLRRYELIQKEREQVDKSKRK
jgi:5-methylcytosine-specific restriction endonuclease McrA